MSLNPPPKPVAAIWHPEWTRLPRLGWARRAFRGFVRLLARLLVRVLTRAEVHGLEHFPRRGPALLVVNHLGDADAVLLLAALPVAPEVLGKVELHDFPVLGKLMEWYGTIWLHRGRPDRRALRCALDGFAEGRFVVIAPEGRYTLIGGLEEGSAGAAYLALKARVPIVPLALSGTENTNVYGSLRCLRRPRMRLTIGEPFYLDATPRGHPALQEGTRRVMESLARLLPPEYRGVYRSKNGQTGEPHSGL